ncbi:hypothetical protein [Flavobacterium sp. ZS1P14]|uniref:hypothetical protein n=1 Tax=Flavobacterium sp. ZS1P14 TaxID=3401729 RepID=UPI003AADF837
MTSELLLNKKEVFPFNNRKQFHKSIASGPDGSGILYDFLFKTERHDRQHDRQHDGQHDGQKDTDKLKK